MVPCRLLKGFWLLHSVVKCDLAGHDREVFFFLLSSKRP